MISFRIKALLVKIDFLFVAVITVFLITDSTNYSAIALLACIIHEIGHLIMFFLVGYCPTELSFELTGIRLTKPTTKLSSGKEVLVLLAGSGTNFILFCLLSYATHQISLVSVFAVTHLVVGIFNLLPLKSFDGGKLLELALLRFCSIKTTYNICTAIDFTAILLLLVTGVYMLIFIGFSWTLTLLSLYLFIAALVNLLGKKN